MRGKVYPCNFGTRFFRSGRRYRPTEQGDGTTEGRAVFRPNYDGSPSANIAKHCAKIARRGDGIMTRRAWLRATALGSAAAWASAIAVAGQTHSEGGRTQ